MSLPGKELYKAIRNLPVKQRRPLSYFFNRCPPGNSQHHQAVWKENLKSRREEDLETGVMEEPGGGRRLLNRRNCGRAPRQTSGLSTRRRLVLEKSEERIIHWWLRYLTVLDFP